VASNTKRKLVLAALDLIWSNSYGSVSVDGICAAADVRKGSFYHFFASKADLVIAAMEEDTRRSLELYEAAFDGGIDPVERFNRLSDAMIAKQKEAAERFGHVPGCPVTSIASEMAGQNDDISHKFEEITLLRRRFFETAVSDLVIEGKLPPETDVGLLGREIHGVLLSAMVLARIENDTRPLGTDLTDGIARTLNVLV
jgi:TetR/AcrR family transcriptional repressor of nem operon